MPDIHRISLLDPEPWARVDEDELLRTLSFAFATGDVGDDFERVVERMKIAPTTWDQGEFSRDIFLKEFVARCLPVVACGKVFSTGRGLLVRLLGEPPADRAVILFRQAIFRELTSAPRLRESTERLYVELAEFRSLLTRAAAGLRLDINRLRLDILRGIVRLIDRAATEFTRAESGLARIAEWGDRVRHSPAYFRLRDLIAYESNACELDLSIRLGFDGRLRDLSVRGRREPVENPFYLSATGRILQKIGLLLRGYRFTEEELLARLIDDVFAGIEAQLVPLFPLIGDLEFYLSGLAFRDGAQRAGLTVSLADFGEEGEGHELTELFNPLLLSEGGGAVPCDIHTARSDSMVIVTGPNSGGKTRLLQSVALTQVLGQAGMFVPAKHARLPYCSGLFVSLIEHATVDQKEGRLGTELYRIRRMFTSLAELRGHSSLVIVDELCSGTNPQEGEDIFRLVVKLLGELRPATFITTHFLAFAQRLANESQRNALEFLQVELAEETPTYRFIPGVAQTSLAHITAARLGVTEEALRALLRVTLAGDGAPKRLPKKRAPVAGHGAEANDADAE
jgi:DNA mismatch repair protein MutS2